MSLNIFSISYPFAPVTEDPVGGAEQVLSRLDRAIVEAGHRSIVIAPEGSAVRGELRPVPGTEGPISNAERARIHAAVRQRVVEATTREEADIVHLHGIDFDAYLPPPGPPMLVTLHLPLGWYKPGALSPRRPATHLHPVSVSQAERAPRGAHVSEPIPNGVPPCPLRLPKADYALALGRICPEKGFDEALDACATAGVPMRLAGSVFPYPEHRAYFADRIAPRLDSSRRWMGAVAGADKQKLLARARCLLVPSKVPETASLVAMEALAAGTPVIAYRAGALPEVVEHGRTGFLVHGPAGMAEAIRVVDAIDPEECRRQAAIRFPLERMTQAYLARYEALAAGARTQKPASVHVATA